MWVVFLTCFLYVPLLGSNGTGTLVVGFCPLLVRTYQVCCLQLHSNCCLYSQLAFDMPNAHQGWSCVHRLALATHAHAHDIIHAVHCCTVSRTGRQQWPTFLSSLVFENKGPVPPHFYTDCCILHSLVTGEYYY